MNNKSISTSPIILRCPLLRLPLFIKPVNDRVAIQTDQTQRSVALLPGKKFQHHQDAGLFRTHRPVTSDVHHKESCYQEGLCQHDHRSATAPEQLRRIVGFYPTLIKPGERPIMPLSQLVPNQPGGPKLQHRLS